MYQIIAKVIVKIISLFMPILMAISPQFALHMKQERDNDFDLWAPKIIEAIEEDDVEALESMMCLDIRTHTENLPEEIQKFYDLIEGEIVELSWDTGAMSYDNGRSRSGYSYKISITTDKQRYTVSGTWEEINTEEPEETKIREMSLWSYEVKDFIWSVSDTRNTI